MATTALEGETTRQRMVRGYSNAIYLDGTRTFATVSTTYHAEIKLYAATHFIVEQIDQAYANGWITEQEWNDTIALIPVPAPTTPATA